MLKSAAGSISGATTSWSRAAGLTLGAGGERWAQVAVIASAVIAFALFAWSRPTLNGLPFAAFALVGGWFLLRSGVGSRRTPTGRLAWSQSGGFQRLLSTDSAEDRFDYSARGDLWIAYVPYAVAFDVADAWAAKYRTATGIEPPSPVWYPVYAHSSSGSGFGSSFDSFDSAVASSISAYSASQSSSSSGGGGGGRRRWWRRGRRFLVMHDPRPTRPDTRGTS